MRMRHIVICGLSGSTIFFNIISQTAIFSGGGGRGEQLLNIKCVFWFSLQISSKIFLITRRNERDMIKRHIGLHEQYPLFLPDFNKTWILSTDFRKILIYQVYWKSLQWKQSFFMRTDISKLMVASRNFANAPKRGWGGRKRKQKTGKTKRNTELANLSRTAPGNSHSGRLV